MANISGDWEGESKYGTQKGQVKINVIFNQLNNHVESAACQLRVELEGYSTHVITASWDGTLLGNDFEATQTNEHGNKFTYSGTLVDDNTISGTWTSHTVSKSGQFPTGTFTLRRKQAQSPMPAQHDSVALTN